MKATTVKEAWTMANELFPTDYEKDDNATDRAGYPIFKSTLDNCRAWISDLGNRLEVNLENGQTINIWIEPETPTERIETTITLESVITHATVYETTTTRKVADLALSSETTLRSIAMFESDARRLIKNARAMKNRGDNVTVTLSKARYTITAEGVTQTSFEMWTSYDDHITIDGVHLNPSEQYNDDPAHDMWITGDRGEIFHEMTI